MKIKTFVLISFLLSFTSCQSQEKKEIKEPTKTEVEESESMKQPFDLL